MRPASSCASSCDGLLAPRTLGTITGFTVERGGRRGAAALRSAHLGSCVYTGTADKYGILVFSSLLLTVQQRVHGRWAFLWRRRAATGWALQRSRQSLAP
jgi:hypothetical protein